MSVVTPDLPRALQPWQEWLGWFDAELARHVGEMLRRLSDLVGTAPSAGRGGAPEPDGLGDLRSRGPYERLLASEWLLAEELPDEFLRRAISSEHLFLAPRLRARQVERSVVAIFDCGPRALGAARLAHIAAWILLARRASDNGGSLRWGVLQQPGMLLPADAPGQLATLMRSRCFEPATASHLTQWRAALEGLAGTGGREAWWIGATGPGMPGSPSRDERTLTLHASLAADSLQARLSLFGAQRSTRLALPPSAETTALLRGEFRSTRMPTRKLPDHRTLRAKRMSLTQGLLMSVPPGHVGVPRLGHPSMLVFSVPRRGQGKLAKPREQTWSVARPPLAATLHRGNTQALSAVANVLHFWQMPRFIDRVRPPREQFEASSSTSHLLRMIRLESSTEQRACVIDAARRLVTWSASHGSAKGNPPPLEATVVDREVLAMTQLGADRLVYAMRYGDGIWLRELRSGGPPSTLRRRLCPAPDAIGELFFSVLDYNLPSAQVGSLAFGHSGSGHQGRPWRACTLRDRGRALDDVDGADSFDVIIGLGERGVGWVGQAGERSPALVVTSTDKRHLHLAGRSGRAQLHESAAPIERCGVCPISGHVAVLTRDRQLTVLDPATREVLLVVTDEAPAGQEDADGTD